MNTNMRFYVIVANRLLKKGIESLIVSQYDSQAQICAVLERDLLNIKLNSDEGLVEVLFYQCENCKSGNPELFSFIKKHPNVRVVALLEHFDYQQVKKMFSIGVSAVISKDIDEDDFFLILNKVIRGGKGISAIYKEAVIELFCQTKIQAETADEESSEIELSDVLGCKYSLTKRERQVLKLIIDGLTTREIADQLFISLHTIETHRRNILKKMDVKNTAEMVRDAIKNQVIPF